MEKRTVALETLGCKVNQYESSNFCETLLRAGYQITSFRNRADIYLVHSCAVTGKAAFQTRQLLRRAQRLNPSAVIVAAGCDAQIEADRLAEERLATHILGSQEKFQLVHWLAQGGTLSCPLIAISNSRQYKGFPEAPVTQMAAARTRAFLKVQDGCDQFCSYCIVPYSRGRSRSLPVPEIQAQMKRFLDGGHQEVVITGIHLGQWGKDFIPAQSVVDLLDSFSESAVPPRLRLSSLETLEWDNAMLKRMPRWRWLCPHFHIPLQSGDPDILKRMHRPYTPQQFADLTNELRQLYPQAALGTDVLVGFPGETQRHFQNTLELLQKLPLNYFHVFPFSPRPNTEAARWTDRITGRQLKDRTQVLRDLSQSKRTAFFRQFLNQAVEVLVEGTVKYRPGWMKGTTANYLQVSFPALPEVEPGSLLWLQINGFCAGGLTGKIAAIPH